MSEFDRLVKTCPECRGDGFIQNPEWRAFMEDCRRVADETGFTVGQVFSMRRADVPDGPEEVPCGTCGGLRMVPTSEGRRVAAILRVLVASEEGER